MRYHFVLFELQPTPQATSRRKVGWALPTTSLAPIVRWAKPSLSIDRDRLGIVQLAGAAVVILKDDLRVRIRHPPLVTQLQRHVEHVVDLHAAKVRIEPLQPRQIGQTGA